MKTIEDLKTELFGKLKKYPLLERFFKDFLERRVELNNNWTENILVQAILDERFSKGNLLETWLEVIDCDLPNYTILREKLTPGDDRKSLDVLAELNGYYHLKKSGFTEIKAILENKTLKTPDYSAKLNNEVYLFEVKNLKSPTDVGDLLFDKIPARRFFNPEVYENIAFHIRLSDAWEEVYFTREDTQALKSSVLDWLTGLFSLIESGENLETASSKVFIFNFKGMELRIECSLKNDGRYIMVGCSGRGKPIDVYRKRDLPLFLNRALRTIERGMSQLFEYDKDDCCWKYVLLHWEKEWPYTVLEREVNAIIKAIDSIVKNFCNKMYVRLLNADSLP